VLIVIAVLFAVVTGLGVGINQHGPEKADDCSQSDCGQNWTAVGTLLGPLMPKLHLDRDAFVIGPNAALPPIVVPRDTDHTFRIATLVLTQGLSVRVAYTDVTEGAGDLRNQSFNLPDPREGKRRGSVVALKAGGTLHMQCEGNQPCRVELQ
jgi:hypothetical protein